MASGEYAARAAYDGPESAEAWSQRQVPPSVLSDDDLIAHLSTMYKTMRDTPIPALAKVHMHAYLWLLADKLFYLSGDMSWQAEEDSHHSKLIDHLAAFNR